MKRLAFILSIFFIFNSCENVKSQNSYQFETVLTGLDTPWEIVWGPDNHIWITERKGDVSRYDPATKKLEKLITIAKVVESSEAGLMGMVLHPSFNDTPHVFVAYNYSVSGNLVVKVSRFTFQDNLLQNEKTIIDNITGNQIHDGCRLAISNNRKLFITTGDAGNQSLSQNNNSLNGKLLRLNLDGSVPNDNPISGNPLWTLGHRNAQGLVIANGKIYSSEHGPANDDELNLIEKGRNYGWPNVHGFCNLPSEKIFCYQNNVAEPMIAWTPTLAVAGIDYYGHSRLPSLTNSIILTSLKAGKVIALKLDASGTKITDTIHIVNNDFGRIRDVSVSPDGRIFIATSNKDGRGNPRPQDDRIIEITEKTSGLENSSGSILNIYPNPASNHIIIDSPENRMNGRIYLISSNGEMIREYILNGEYRKNLSVNDLSPGLYFLQLQLSDKLITRKIMVSRAEI